MKKLFIIHRIDNNTKKKKNNELFHCLTKKDPGRNCSSLKLSDNQLNIINSSPSTTTNYSTDSIKYSLNFSSSELSSPIASSNRNIVSNEFLDKNTKFNKDISENSENNLIEKIVNTINEETKKINSFDLNISKEKNKKIKEKKNSFINEGRWSYEEHIKFIEALIEYGKNWKKVQKYVGTRSTSQIRSHSQKFLLKLKMIKNTNLNIDFKTNKIKNLSDIILEIKRQNINNEDEKTFILNYFMNLNEIIAKENSKINKRKKEVRLNKDSSKLNNDNSKLNIEINKQSDNLNNKDETNISNNTNFNEEKINESKINEINNEKNNSIFSENKSNNNITINNDILKKENEEIINRVEEDSWKDNEYIYNNKLIFDDDFAFYGDDCSYFNYNNISGRIKEYEYNLNFESSSIFNKYFFS